MDSIGSIDTSVWSVIKSRSPSPEVNEIRIKIGRTLLQENETLHEEKSALQSILYELYGDRLKKPRKPNSLEPHPPQSAREGGGNRLFRDALLYSKLHYDTSPLSDETNGKAGQAETTPKPNMMSPSKLKNIVKASNPSSLTAVKSHKLNSITETSTFEEVLSIISSVSQFNISLIDSYQTFIQTAILIENKKLNDLCESYRQIMENGLNDLSEGSVSSHTESSAKSKSNNNEPTSTRGNSSSSKTRDRFRGLKEDIYFMDD